MLLLAASVAAGDKLREGKAVREAVPSGDNTVRHRCLATDAAPPIQLPLQRETPWSLPKQALPQAFDTVLNVLVLRYDFQFESTDDPNTTGRGSMNLSNPLLTPADSAAYFDSIGHWIDPPPHDSGYFDAHMRALTNYWERVSDGKLSLSWDIFPPVRDSAYLLPQPMSYYGRCDLDSVVVGLENYFQDCIRLADSAHIVDLAHPDIDFSQYQAIILFHAGSDRQNDIGFPETCSDLFTGFILFGDSVVVDNGAGWVRTALMMPETASQDNRATALNAVLAHEFGHQLGLVDLYATNTFLSQLGDFALMDNNGFGTGIDFGFPAGRSFGAIPLFPCVWSRAHLGFIDVVDFRQGSDIRLVAAEIVSEGIKAARIPITEKEYYLIENRLIDTDNLQTFSLVDSNTNVILGPVNAARQLTGEYDFLMPGSGVLIFHVDESVAGLDWDNDGLDNFQDNDLQNNPGLRFITLVEGDGLVNFGGNYRAGFGRAEDMYREDRNDAFTPNTNPPAIDNTGNNTHIYLTDIHRDTTDGSKAPMDTVIRFNVETDRLVNGFPVRVTSPLFGLSAVADDINHDGTEEVIVASGQVLSVMTTTGENFLRKITNCTTCPIFYDTAIASINTGVPQPVPLYFNAPADITAGPVTGTLSGDTNTFVAIGHAPLSGETDGRVVFLRPDDPFALGHATAAEPLNLTGAGTPIAMSLGSRLWVLTDNGTIFRKDQFIGPATMQDSLPNDEYHGICRLGDNLSLLAGTSDETTLYFLHDTIDSVSLGGYYSFGPITVDVDLDGLPEIVAFSPDGDGIYVTIDTTSFPPVFSVLAAEETSYPMTTNPIATDIDLDGIPDIVIGGVNELIAFDRQLTVKTDFPLKIDDRFPSVRTTAAPVSGDIDIGGRTELVFPTDNGNVYSYGSERSFGFPLSGGEVTAGSILLFHDSTGGKLGYVGADGWFYAWETDLDTSSYFWPMGGADPFGSLSFDQSRLVTPGQPQAQLPDSRFYNYPNPVTNGRTTIRYFLGEAALTVTLAVYDLSGQEVDRFDGPIEGGVDNEVVWMCGDVTPGVYRCVIDVAFGESTSSSYTDIAIIR
jgi:M6 family metalloprotease-like protein